MVFYDIFISTRRCFYFGGKMKKKEISKLEKEIEEAKEEFVNKTKITKKEANQ